MISLVIATYNRKNLLPRCIKSILSQTHVDFEIIVVDDGSTDGTEDIFSSVFNDPRIKYFKLEHGGVSWARNFGLQKISGSYFIIWDSDDELLPKALEKLNDQFIKFPQASLVSAPVSFREGEKEKNFSSTPTQLLSLQDVLMEKLPANEELVMVKTSDLGSAKFFSKNLDYMFYHYIARGKKWLHFNEILGVHYSNQSSLTKARKIPNVAASKDRQPFLVKYLGDFGELLRGCNKLRFARISYATALSLLLSGQNKKAAGYAVDALKSDGKIKYFLLFIFCYIPFATVLAELLYNLKAFWLTNRTH